MSKKKRDDSYFAAGRRRNRKYMMIILPIIIVVAAAGAAGALLYQPAQALAISGVECNRTEQLNYHVHAHLDVFVDGEKQQIPDNVGILSTPSCLYWLHTHDTTGLIHVEAPQTRDFTLGQFLDVWNNTRDPSGLLESVSAMNATAYVNGDQIEGNYRNVQLESLEQIALVYGRPPEDIPADYDFDVQR
ncbi:MAG TPA: hypothetical protein VI338_02185 [Nitrososphaera sp.]|nr:hypothetical protein [Nitrososphaera sp.]